MSWEQMCYFLCLGGFARAGFRFRIVPAAGMPQIEGAMEELVEQFARVAGSFVEAVAVLTFAYGSVEAFIKLLPVVARPGT